MHGFRFAAVAALLLWAGASESKRVLKDPSTVPFSFAGAGGNFYVKTEAGDLWRIEPSDADLDNSYFFYNEKTKATQWADPRIPEDDQRITLEVKDKMMLKTKMTYFFDDNGKVQPKPIKLSETAMDTDKLFDDKKKSTAVKEGETPVTKAVIVVVPLILFILGVAARIFYLHAYYPDLLFPTKERRQRNRGSSKFKPQKARGKMSQDGKGGRSANS